ncbi:MAG: methyl-accepting chemotaxis protein [Methylococcales bacterium]|nr:methyl-accepting chemotaxis protein [Methylococcales bacterium]MBT7409980.1 methyl-accepting chemotaxis protein [Methylococcales bacterium]
MISFIFDINYLLKSYIKHNNTDIFIVSSANTIEDSSNPHLYTELNISPPPFGDDSSVVKEINQQFFLITTQTIRSTKKQNLAYLITTENISLNFSTSKSSLWLSFLVGLIIIIITSIIISLFVKRHTKAEQDKINQLISAVHRVNGLDFSVRLDEINDNSKISQFNKSFNTMVTTFDSITCDTQVQLSEMTSIIGDIRGKSEFIQDVIGLASQGDLTGEMMIFSGGETIDQVANSIATMLENLNELIGKVKQSGAQVTSSATEIAATAKQQEATVTEQAATVNEIMSTVQDISSTSKDLVDTMHEVAEVAESTAEGAAQSQSSLLNMETSMHQMMDATESIGSKLSVINEKASNINTVVTTITKVADQTNLLSLNAAIEAEKAGEYGAGFSVVATEIRRLADQTAVATWDIEQMVKEMQAAVSAGVMGMDKFSDEVRAGVQNVADVGSQLADIIDRVQTLIPRFDSVHEGMQSQSLAAEQISESMVQLNESAQQTADSLIHSNDAIMQLNYAAHILQDAVSRFTLKD